MEKLGFFILLMLAVVFLVIFSTAEVVHPEDFDPKLVEFCEINAGKQKLPEPNVICIKDVLTSDAVSFDATITYTGDSLPAEVYAKVEKKFKVVMNEHIKVTNDPLLIKKIYGILYSYFVSTINDSKYISITAISLKPNNVIKFSNSNEIKDKIFDFYFGKDKKYFYIERDRNGI